MRTGTVAGLALTSITGLASAQEIVALPADFEPVCISGDGLVVGGNFNSAIPGHPALWTRERGVELLRFPDGQVSGGRVWALNVDGSAAVGLSRADSVGPANPMRWTRTEGVQSFTGIIDGAPTCYGISDDGRVIVGMGWLNGTPGFTWTAEHGLRNLPESVFGEATCVSGDGRYFGGGVGILGSGGIWLWSMDSYSGHPVTSPNPLSGWARALNRTGDVMVGFYRSDRGTQGFLWTTQGLQLAPQVRTFHDVTADGRTAVGQHTSRSAAYYTQGLGAIRLDSFLQNSLGMDLSGWSLDEALAISDDGRVITGTGSPSNWVVYLPAPRPGDFNGDEEVTTEDLISYFDCFAGEALLPPTAADVTKDDFTDWIDFDEFLASF